MERCLGRYGDAASCMLSVISEKRRKLKPLPGRSAAKGMLRVAEPQSQA